ncbi:30S ribosomal protein S15 [uncultured archaeon]|nr:30S ribosomal protein S15 [uncultured archaeon]
MAKLHTKKKGRAGSRKVKGGGKWVELGKDEIEKIIFDLHKSGTAPSAIGHILRDQHGIPDVRANMGGKSILQIIEGSGKTEYPENLANLIKKAVKTKAHLLKHKSDVHNRIKLQSTEAKIRRLGKYYARVGKLPSDWTYDPAKAALLFK